MELKKIKILSNSASLLPIISLLFLLSCSQQSKNINKELKNTIEIGDYSFDFPANFKLVKEQGVDSYVGRIEDNNNRFEFDFGLYTSTLTESPEEYLKEGYWRFDLSERFMKPNITYDKNNEPKVEVLSIRQANRKDSLIGKGCDYIAHCQHEKITFDFPIYLPAETKAYYFKTDTIDGIYQKVVYAKDPKKGITGMYLAKLGNKRALSLVAHHLSCKEQEMVLKIFSTAKYLKN
ncbi:hypothetical protein VRU48_18285 [Pedobacter sp. KR3-3]|uniref:Lipoprotein n=1 Tax=Pedobacter albus TaxID=3113905 RepID=A0ABU7IC75_9SPHI|nr:hypothetical protein [Pedobacter sp. KR3-3]MEE1947080.1 hypothetical protein [Pedobacter sp. KR3-3]